MAGNFDRIRATNPHPNPTDFAHDIGIRRMRILAGFVTLHHIPIVYVAVINNGNRRHASACFFHY